MAKQFITICRGGLPNLYIEVPSLCPHCGIPTYRKPISEAKYQYGDFFVQYFELMCCNKITCSLYEVLSEYHNGSQSEGKETKLVFSYPIANTIPVEVQKLKSISTNFVEIYSQAMKAQALGLSHLVGPALRKAIEFLVKDYLLMTNAMDEESLRNTSLRNCINTHLQNEDLIAVMNAAVLIGNDEVHWVKNFPDFDVQDMGSFANVAIAIMNSKAEILRAKNLREEAIKK